MNLSVEVWKDIPGFEGRYAVSTMGRVKSLPRYVNCRWDNDKYVPEKILRATPKSNNSPYLTVPLGLGKNRNVHILVLETFIGSRPDGMETRHLNGNRNDNRLENLAWGTRQENIADRGTHGNNLPGERNPNSKLTESDVLKIRKLHTNGYSYSEIGKQFNITKTNVYYIVKRKSWAHI